MSRLTRPTKKEAWMHYGNKEWHDKIYAKLAAIEDIEEEFGVDFQAIYTLAKSQIATAKNNIELQDKIEKLEEEFSEQHELLDQYELNCTDEIIKLKNEELAKLKVEKENG